MGSSLYLLYYYYYTYIFILFYIINNINVMHLHFNSITLSLLQMFYSGILHPNTYITDTLKLRVLPQKTTSKTRDKTLVLLSKQVYHFCGKAVIV